MATKVFSNLGNTAMYKREYIPHVDPKSQEERLSSLYGQVL